MAVDIWIQGDGPSHGIAALKITGIRARESKRGRLEPDALRGPFQRQKDLICALSSPNNARRFELRTIVTPEHNAPGLGTVAIYLLIRCDAETPSAARQQTMMAFEDVRALMRGLGDVYDVEGVKSTAELSYALRPFRCASIAELKRREGVFSPGRLEWTRPSRIGFGASDGDGDDAQPGLYHTYAWVPPLQNVDALYRVLMDLPTPLLISTQIEPIVLPDSVHQAAQTSLSRVERWLASASVTRSDDDVEQMSLGILKALANDKLGQLTRLENAAFRVRVRMASPLPLRGAAIQSVAQGISRPVGHSAAESSLMLSGGIDWSMLEGEARSWAEAEMGGLGAPPLESELLSSPERELLGILTADEVLGAFRLPVPDIEETPGITTRFCRFVSLPRGIPAMGALLGRSTDTSGDHEVRILADDRRRHCYVVGQSGTGKSTLFMGMALEDIRQGAGVCVIDPHGDLIEEILLRFPKERADDLILFDASDREQPLGLNPLEWTDESEKMFVVQEMVAMFQRLFSVDFTGPVFERTFRACMLTVMANPQKLPGTLLEIPRLFADPMFHKKYLSYIKEPHVRSYWNHDYEQMSSSHRGEMMGYITSKFERFVSDPLMRNIIGQQQSSLKLSSIMNEGKILLVSLGKGTIGEINSSILGTILVTKLQAAAMARAALPPEQRRDFYFYVDEFQNFATSTFSSLLSEARKFRLNMVLTNQYMSQLRGELASESVLSAVFGNVGTLIAMRVGAEDATDLEQQFAPTFLASDLQSIPNWHAYVNLLVEGQRMRPFSIRTVKDGVTPSKDLADALKQLCRRKFGKRRSSIEREIAARWR